MAPPRERCEQRPFELGFVVNTFDYYYHFDGADFEADPRADLRAFSLWCSGLSDCPCDMIVSDIFYERENVDVLWR